MGETESGIYRGTVKRIIYRNQSNGYTVALILCDRVGELTAVGNLFDLEIGEEAEFSGNFTFHKNYGEQLNVVSYQKLIPSSAAAILRYLSSGTVSGIGPATAKKIVRKFGDRSLTVMENSPEEIAEIKGITLSKAETAAKELREHRSLRECTTALLQFGISNSEAIEIVRILGVNCVKKIEENPYILCSDKIGFTFQKAEEIAEKLEIPPEFPDRLGWGLVYILKHNLINGHTCLPRGKLLSVAKEMLDVNLSNITDALDEFVYNSTLAEKSVEGQQFVYLREYYDAECRIAGRLMLIDSAAAKLDSANEKEIKEIQKEVGVNLEQFQRDAVAMSVESGVLVLTGGPGTGKTTTLKAIIEAMKKRDLKLSLAAPTGRAAKRMSELTGIEAKTIHRLLEVEWQEGEEKHIFARNPKNPLDCDLLIIDEFSMVDTLLFESVLDALRLGCRIILVGDPDQLPSIGAGDLLHDIISSERIKCVCLKKVFRQANDSLIISNAHRIIAGYEPELSVRDRDFFMIDSRVPSSALKKVRELYTERLPNAYGYDPMTDIQVLCPSKMMELGTLSVNNCLQKYVNPPADNKKEINFRSFVLREGDKVMQNKNNYDIIWRDDSGEGGMGVYNGDIGLIEKIDFSSATVFIRFDNRLAEYSTDDMQQIELAYAVTVHKSQGSEFDCVILPVLDTPPKLRYRNLLYTAVTRAKKQLIIVGKREIVLQMVENGRKTLRYTGLCEFLRGL